MPAMWPWCN